MIDRQLEESRAVRGFWSGHVRQRIAALDLDDNLSVAEISESLATVCEQHAHMPEHSLSLLLARSFCATGNADAAGQILRDDQCYRAHAEVWLSALSAEYPFPELFPLFSSRTLRPLRLKTVSDSTAWVLDFKNVHFTSADRHELILLQTLRVLAEKVSNVWKKTDGEGTLAVKGLASVNSFFGTDLSAYLRDVLYRCAQKNSWAHRPTVLLLDL